MSKTSQSGNYEGGGNAGTILGILFGGILLVAVVGGAIFFGMKMLDKMDSIADGGGKTTIIEVPVSTDKEEEKVEKPLSDMPSVVGNFYDVFTMSNNLQDNVGNIYETGYSFLTGKEITYILDGQYDTLEGTIAVAMEDKDDLNFACVYVYDENHNLIYESEWIDRTKHPEPVKINCNVTGLQRITIEFEGATWTAGRLQMVTDGFKFTA